MSKWTSVDDCQPTKSNPLYRREWFDVLLEDGTQQQVAYEFDFYENMLFEVGWHETPCRITHWKVMEDVKK